MAANGDNQTVSEYIVHHLTNLTYGKLPEGFEREDGTVISAGGQWTLAHGPNEMSVMGFNAIHVDSMLWSVGLGLIFLLAISPCCGEGFFRYPQWVDQFCRNGG